CARSRPDGYPGYWYFDVW
nr:immunoglobulin heavy chain junction region [Mus musculus]MBK4185727.1 immunoglobulin heavy chain junction region [Mus musculus]MBK4185728.1 immunoglobulin heavy chain junction region [Mus musculus]MBK4185729.1 immunoglobulin heavy chain junction region [Mus musculus]